MEKTAIKTFAIPTAAYSKRTAMGSKGNECACCGKPTREEFYVETPENGYYPVGPECFKKLAKAGYAVLTREQLDAE